jgi:hypothetical protein
MNEDKGTVEEHSGAAVEEADEGHPTASRARNRTVMLTPEMTGQVRALLHQDPSAHQPEAGSDPLEDFLPPLVDWDSPTDSPANGGAGFAAHEPVVDAEVTGYDDAPEEQLPAYDPMTMVAPPVRKEAPIMSARPTAAAPTTVIETPREAEPVPAPAATPAPQAAVAAARPQASFSVNTQARAPRTPSGTRPTPASSTGTTKIVGFLVSFDSDKNGEVYEIRSGRWLVTSRPTDHGEFILIHDETISPLHAILRATKDGKLQVLDQLSEFGTGVKKVGDDEEKEVAGGLEEVNHGDIVRFGERHFVICLVPNVVVEEPKETVEE